MRHLKSVTRVLLPRAHVFGSPQVAPVRLASHQRQVVRCRSGSVVLASESRSVLAPVRLPLRQRPALRYQAGSDGASTTDRIGLEDGQHIVVAEIIQWLRAFSRRSRTQRTTPTDTLVRNHQQGSDHYDDGFVRERFPRKRQQNSTHLRRFHWVLEAP